MPPSGRSSTATLERDRGEGQGRADRRLGGAESPGAGRGRARRRRRRSSAASRSSTLLRETFARVIREREPQLVTLVGVPGIGKSRLVFELFQTIESGDYGLVYWRHGRSLPYGEGVTFWALGEMVKAQAGILESDGPDAGGEQASPSRRALRRRRRGSGLDRAARCVRSPGSRRTRRPATGATRRSPPGGASSRRSPTSARSSSSSRTSTGRTTRCSTSSTTSSTGRAACRCSSSAPLVRSSSRGDRAGAAGR